METSKTEWYHVGKYAGDKYSVFILHNDRLFMRKDLQDKIREGLPISELGYWREILQNWFNLPQG